jgi:hypothetical protein
MLNNFNTVRGTTMNSCTYIVMAYLSTTTKIWLKICNSAQIKTIKPNNARV